MRRAILEALTSRAGTVSYLLEVLGLSAKDEVQLRQELNILQQEGLVESLDFRIAVNDGYLGYRLAGGR